MMSTLKTTKSLLTPTQKKTDDATSKVSIVGTGSVGMAAVFALVHQNVSKNVVMVDVASGADRMNGELMDLLHGTVFLSNVKLHASTDLSLTADSKVIIVTVGIRQKVGETRLQLLEKNAEIFKEMIPVLAKHSPEAIILVASNPVDILTYLSWRVSGFPQQRVIGAGTSLDTARFRYYIGKRLGIATTSVHGFVIGEHGDSSVPVWSGVNVAGVKLADINPRIGTDADPEKWSEIHDKVVQSAYTIIKLKGYTSSAIGLVLSQLTNAILTDAKTVHPGEQGIDVETYTSLPCALGRHGVYDIVNLSLSDMECSMLHKSVKILVQSQARIKY